MPTLSKYVAANADDGYSKYPGSFDNGANYAICGQDDSGDGTKACHGFFRIADITIPPVATIDTCYLQMYNFSTTSTVRLTFYFEDADNPSAVTSYSDHMGRSKTGGVNWTASGSGTVNSPSLVTGLQTVVNRAGWTSGNAVQVHLMDNGSDGDKKCTPGTINGGYAAMLYVDYTPKGDIFRLASPIIGLFEKMKRRTSLYRELLAQGAIQLGKQEMLPI